MPIEFYSRSVLRGPLRREKSSRPATRSLRVQRRGSSSLTAIPGSRGPPAAPVSAVFRYVSGEICREVRFANPTLEQAKSNNLCAQRIILPTTIFEEWLVLSEFKAGPSRRSSSDRSRDRRSSLSSTAFFAASASRLASSAASSALPSSFPRSTSSALSIMPQTKPTTASIGPTTSEINLMRSSIRFYERIDFGPV